MDFLNCLSGSAPAMRRYQIATTIANSGVPHLVPGTGGVGVAVCTTTGADGMIGCNLDAALTYQAAQNASGADQAALAQFIINPDAIWRARLSGGATENTALTLYDVSTASTDGLSVTTGDDFSSPTYDEGVGWGYDGGNAGKYRAITSVSSTAFTVILAFPADTVVGDNFMVAPAFPLRANTVTLTTLLTQVRADLAVATNTAALRAVGVELRGIAENGRTNSFVDLISGNHIFGGVLT